MDITVMQTILPKARMYIVDIGVDHSTTPV